MNMEPIHLPYYHPGISSADEANQVLLKHLEKGSFILRRSTKEQRYTLSVVYSEKMIHHVTIKRKNFKFFLVKSQKFDSIDDLVSFYKCTDIFHAQYKPFRLVRGVEKSTLPPRPPKRPRTNNSIVDNGFSSSHLNNQSDLKTTTCSFCDNNNENTPQWPPKPKPSLDVQPVPDHMTCPLPLPTSKNTNAWCTDLSVFIKSYGEGICYESLYSEVKDNQKDRTDELIKMLIERDQLELQTIKCECGVYHKDSQLADGWTVHRSRDVRTEGQLFFTSSDGVTSWTLPDKVWFKLTPEHVRVLTQLAYEFNAPVPAPVEYLQSRQY